MRRKKIDDKIIRKSVYYSQKIEGYERPSKEVEVKASLIRKKYNVKISLHIK